MHIKYLQLINFRNYGELDLQFSDNVNVFIGDNAQGKTNILESIYYCSIGKSHRTSKDKELVAWNKNEAYIKAYIARKRLDKKIEIKIFKEGKKGMNINSIKVRKISELMGNFNVVMFSPEDLKIVKESPSYRRKFLDIELCKISEKYYFNLVQYNKVLEERNNMLRKFNGQDYEMLDIYDMQLAKYGSKVAKIRHDYIKKLNCIGEKIHEQITDSKENIKFKYVSVVKNINDSENDILDALASNRKKDLEKRTTSDGIHRDDFQTAINGVDARIFGSQGQQRTAVLTIKFSSLEIIKEEIGEYPVLLLDDVLSELDSNRQKFILSSIKDIQTMITCTGYDDVKKYIGDDAALFHVENGEISKI